MNMDMTIKHLYPNISDSDFMLKNDGGETYIYSWESEFPEPTKEMLESVKSQVELENEKQIKKVELNKACNQTIIGKFAANVDGVTYYFSNDAEAQSNFKDAKMSFDDGTIDLYMGGLVMWTAYDENGNVVRLTLNKSQFIPVNVARMFHQQNNISKLRDELEPMINAVTIETPDALNIVRSITW